MLNAVNIVKYVTWNRFQCCINKTRIYIMFKYVYDTPTGSFPSESNSYCTLMTNNTLTWFPNVHVIINTAKVMLCWQFSGRLLRMNCDSGSQQSTVKQEEDSLIVAQIKLEPVRKISYLTHFPTSCLCIDAELLLYLHLCDRFFRKWESLKLQIYKPLIK